MWQRVGLEPKAGRRGCKCIFSLKQLKGVYPLATKEPILLYCFRKNAERVEAFWALDFCSTFDQAKVGSGKLEARSSKLLNKELFAMIETALRSFVKSSG